MSTNMFDIPEDCSQWPKWLDQRMVSFNLRDLVDQLTYAQKNESNKQQSLDEVCGRRVGCGEASPDRSRLQHLLDEVCGPQMPRVLEQGCSQLSTSQIRQLFKQPQLLLELQARVLEEGGSYWDDLELPPQEQAIADASTQRTLQKLEKALAAEGHKRNKPTDTGSRIWGLLALAAALLIAIGIWRNIPGRSSGGWGFESAGLLTANVSAPKYLSNLANAAGQWSNKRPTDAASLEIRLREFRRGCTALIEAPHTQLAQADREWLIGKCKEWAAKIDGYILELQNGSSPVEQVRSRADETIQRLQQALRDRALQTV